MATHKTCPACETPYKPGNSACNNQECELNRPSDEPPPGFFVHARDMWDTLTRIAGAEPRPNKRGKYSAHDLDNLQRAASSCLERIRNPHNTERA